MKVMKVIKKKKIKIKAKVLHFHKKSLVNKWLFLENVMQFENMEELREEIDLLDNELIILFSKRFKFIEDAALIKNDINDIRDNERIEKIIKRLRNLAKKNNLSEDIIEKLWRFIIELSIEQEREIFKNKK